MRALNSQVKLWAIDRPAFQTVMVKTNIIRQQDYIELLKRLTPRAGPLAFPSFEAAVFTNGLIA